MKNKLLYKNIKDHLIEIIAKLKTDIPLPSQTQLTHKFGVNHLTVRRAFKELEAEGLIYTIRGKGRFIRQNIKQEESMRFLIMAPSFWKEEENLGMLAEGMMKTSLLNNIDINISANGYSGPMNKLINLSKFNGSIWAYPSPEQMKAMNDFFERGYPVMALNRIINNFPFSYISTDHKKGAYELSSYLLKKGHRKIGLVGLTKNSPLIERYEGFIKALEEAGIKTNQAGIVKIDSLKEGEKLLKEVEGDVRKMINVYRPTAIFIAAGTYLSPVLAVVKEKRLNIPEDIEIATYDEVPQHYEEKVFIHEAVQPLYEIGKRAILEMTKIVRGDNGIVRIALPPTLHTKGETLNAR